MLEGMPDRPNSISVVDFRRTRLVLEWNTLGGTWTACDTPPALVHGIALIRPGQSSICIFGSGGRLTLQVGPQQIELNDESPRISCTRGVASFGLRRNFVVQPAAGAEFFSHSYWSHRRDFFRWLAERSADRQWREGAAEEWTRGVAAQVMRP